MTNEAIKALMIFALYGALDITLFYSSIVRFAKRPARFHIRRGEARDLPVGQRRTRMHSQMRRPLSRVQDRFLDRTFC